MRLVMLARSHTAAAINTLAKIMSDELATESARVSAAVHLLDRGWGKPQQNLVLAGKDTGPIESTATSARDELTSLVSRYAAARRETEGSHGPH
jgi:hypothetical protein